MPHKRMVVGVPLPKDIYLPFARKKMGDGTLLSKIFTVQPVAKSVVGAPLPKTIMVFPVIKR